jgi:hypothetical protein
MALEVLEARKPAHPVIYVKMEIPLRRTNIK